MDIHHHGKKVEVPMSHEELSNFPIPAEERNRLLAAEPYEPRTNSPLMAENLRLRAQVRTLNEVLDRVTKDNREDKRPKWVLSVPRFGIGRLVVWLFRRYLNRQMWDLKVRGRAPLPGARRQYPYGAPLNLSTRVAVYILPKRKRSR